MTPSQLAQLTMQRLDILGRISEEPGKLTRTYGSTAMQHANETVAGWMRQAGMEVRRDAIGNIIGHYPGDGPKTLLLGSHLDTVRDAGKYDGPLGVLVALACVEALHATGIRLPFAIQAVGFADEEGVRFQSTYLGSRALAGTFNPQDLELKDANGVTMREAIRAFGGNPDELYKARCNSKSTVGYVEVHIEQGPVLQEKEQPLGLVTAISGQTRMRFTYTGKAGHAGTTPMHLRKDALCAAAEFVVEAEEYAQINLPLVATVGQIQVRPGASNVIPGEATFTLDLRHEDDKAREAAREWAIETAQDIAEERELSLKATVVQETPTIRCSKWLCSLLEEAARAHEVSLPKLASGAGHDAAALSAVMPVGMLFVRCRDGLSHHPDEWVEKDDVEDAIKIMLRFLKLVAKEQGRV